MRDEIPVSAVTVDDTQTVKVTVPQMSHRTDGKRSAMTTVVPNHYPTSLTEKFLVKDASPYLPRLRAS